MTAERIRPGQGPLYRQVKQRVIRGLIDEVWKPGDILPSEPRLAAAYGVSPGTVRRALDELVAENLLLRHQGKGTIVCRHDPERSLFHFFRMADAAGERPVPESRVLGCVRRRAERAEAARLGLAAGSAVVAIDRVRMAGGRPLLVERLVLPARPFAPLAELPPAELPNTLYTLYETRFGVTVYRAAEQLRAVAADAREADLLDVAPGTPLLEIDRLATALDGAAVEWRVSRCRTDAYRYRVELV